MSHLNSLRHTNLQLAANHFFTLLNSINQDALANESETGNIEIQNSHNNNNIKKLMMIQTQFCSQSMNIDSQSLIMNAVACSMCAGYHFSKTHIFIKNNIVIELPCVYHTVSNIVLESFPMHQLGTLDERLLLMFCQKKSCVCMQSGCHSDNQQDRIIPFKHRL